MGAKQNIQIDAAIKDLAAIRGAIDLNRLAKRSHSRRQAYFILQAILLVCALAFAGIEIFTHGQMSAFLQIASHEQNYFWFSVAYIGVFLIMISGTAAMIMARSAKMNEEEVGNYLDRHFQSFRDLSVFSDLMIKLVMLAALLATGRSLWIAPLLFLFTGDFVLQRRVVQISNRTAFILAASCVAASTLQFGLHSGELVWPLSGFSMVLLISLASLMRQPKDQS